MVQRPWTYLMHENGGRRTVELSSNDVVVRSPQDVLDILGDLMDLEIDEVILHKHNVTPDFFDLSTKNRRASARPARAGAC